MVNGEDGRIRLINRDDGRRRRVTVFFRLLLAIPQIVWWLVWSLGAIVVAPIHWLVTLVRGRPLDALHAFYASYTRFTVHLYAYVYLAAERWPPFLGEPGYEIDLDVPPPVSQGRWTILVRFVIALPALAFATVLLGDGTGGESWNTQGSAGDAEWQTTGGAAGVGVIHVLGVCAWVASVALSRTPRGLRDAIAYCVWYSAQTWGYLFFLTARYPTTDPTPIPREPPPPHPVRLEILDEDRGRNRLLVLFRFLAVIPHLIWVTLWSIVALVAAVVAWVVVVVRGELPSGLHQFLERYVRYRVHLNAFLLVLGDPFPPFTGAPRGYPIDLEVEGPQRQSRATAFFRLVFAIPALLISTALGSAQVFAGVGAWSAALVIGRIPQGLFRFLAWTVRYQGQVGAYVFLLTERYPYTGPDGPGVQADWMVSPEVPPAAGAVAV